MEPFDIYEVPEYGDPKKIGETVTPGGSLTRMIDQADLNDEEVIEVTKNDKSDGDGFTVVSKTLDDKFNARTSIYRKP